MTSAIKSAPLYPRLAQPAVASVAQPPRSPNPDRLGEPGSQAQDLALAHEAHKQVVNNPKRTD